MERGAQLFYFNAFYIKFQLLFIFTFIELFHERIEKEDPECPMEERVKRSNKINAYIAEKIVTLTRKKIKL